MASPQEPEPTGSAKTDLDADQVETGLPEQRKPAVGGETGPVPPENQPGHHPPKEQDKPDLDAFAAKLGTDPKAPTAANARKPASPRKTTPAKAASRPAATNPQKSPAAPPKIEVTPAKRPAAVPAPTRDAAAHFSAPQPEPEEEWESRLAGLVLLPLRETVKRLEQLERRLTKRLATAGRGSRGR
jgi:hypothetical protein